MEVDVEDVQLQMQPPPQQHVNAEPVAMETAESPAYPEGLFTRRLGQEGFDPQYVRSLLINCVQASVAQVRDCERKEVRGTRGTKEGMERATKRIELLLQQLEGMQVFIELFCTFYLFF
jgi:hypothetical protein